MTTVTRQHRNPYVHRSCIASVCAACDGTGRTIATRGSWTGDIRCETCDGYGETYRSEFAGESEPTPPETVTFGGHVIDAPGFSQDQFERAMCRALVDELEIHTDATGQAIVCHRGINGGYAVSKTRCGCKAGQVGTPCKHRAALLFHLQVRLPAVRKQWQRLNAQRPATATA